MGKLLSETIKMKLNVCAGIIEKAWQATFHSMQVWDCLLIISMKYVFKKKEISEGIWLEIFDEHINSN